MTAKDTPADDPLVEIERGKYLPTERGKPIGRRVFLGLIGLGALGVMFGSKLQDGLAKVAAKDPTGLTGLLPLAGFRLYTVTDGFPSRSEADYTLEVKGLVENPFTLTFAELQALPSVEMTKDFQCVTGWRVQDVHWKGVLLRDLLIKAKVKPEAVGIRFTSFDKIYTESLTLDQASRMDVIVAYELQKKPISSEHGGPARLYVAPMYGYKSCKWLDSIELTPVVYPGYWEERGYDVDAWIGQSNGRDDEPVP